VNILMLTSFYPPAKGGIQTYSYQIASNLQKRDNMVTVFALSSDGIKKILRSPSLKWYHIGKESSKCRWCSDYDVILATSWFPAGLLGAFLSKLRGIPLFVSAHGNEILYPRQIPLMKQIMLCVFGCAQQVFAVSKYTKQLLEKQGVESAKIVVIPNGTDPDRFNPHLDVSEIRNRHSLHGKKVIFSVSRLVERKNFGMVISVLPEIREEVPNVVYLIGGSGPMKEAWQKLAEDLEVDDAVIFTGYIPDEELPKYYAASDVFVMPSLEMEDSGEVEGFGIAFLEANACGTPVVGGNTGGMRDAIVDGETGLLVDPNNNDKILSAIFKILKNPSLANTMGRNGRLRIVQYLSWKKVAENMLSTINYRIKGV